MKCKICLGECDEARKNLGLKSSCCENCHSELMNNPNDSYIIWESNGYYAVCCHVFEEWKAKDGK
jgi:hypothetical protein